MSRLLIGTLAVSLSSAAAASDNQEPTLPYFDQGACPFECCTYRVWGATKDTVLRTDARDSAPVVSTVKGGEKVRGLTGVVITAKAGKVVVQKAMRLHKEGGKVEVSLKPGDVIYYLHYVGAGYDKFWFRGQLLVDQTDIRKVGKDEWFEVANLPEWTWWAKVQRPNGDIGWTRELRNFSDIDACG
jgi:hypothetical protein